MTPWTAAFQASFLKQIYTPKFIHSAVYVTTRSHIICLLFEQKYISPCYETWRIKTVAHVCIYWVLQMSSLGGGLTIHPLVPAFTPGSPLGWCWVGLSIQMAELRNDRKWDSARSYWCSTAPSPQHGVFWGVPSFCSAVLSPVVLRGVGSGSILESSQFLCG